MSLPPTRDEHKDKPFIVMTVSGQEMSTTEASEYTESTAMRSAYRMIFSRMRAMCHVLFRAFREFRG